MTELDAHDGRKLGTFTAGGDIYMPFALAFDGAHIWVANANNNNTVTELNATNGTKIGTFTGGGDQPHALVFDGVHLWVANFGANSVTELNAADGSKVGTFTADGDINGVDGLAFDGAHIWVANFGANSVTELNAVDGSKVGTFTAGGDLDQPFGMAFDGAHIWVANFGANSVTELNAVDGSKVGTFTAGGDIDGPVALVFAGAHLWVGNWNGSSVTELNAADGSKVGTFTAGGDIDGPVALAFDGAHIWVANFGSMSVTELNGARASTLGTTGTIAGATGVAAQPLITYCDLVGSPLRYLGKEVRVVGVYRAGFEWQELYSTRCPDAYTTTVEWNGHDACPDLPESVKNIAPDINLHKAGKLDYGRTTGLIARGTLVGGDGVGYGHMNAYTFHFDVGCVEYEELLDVPSYTVHALTRGMRRRVERFLAKTDSARASPPKR